MKLYKRNDGHNTDYELNLSDDLNPIIYNGWHEISLDHLNDNLDPFRVFNGHALLISRHDDYWVFHLCVPNETNTFSISLSVSNSNPASALRFYNNIKLGKGKYFVSSSKKYQSLRLPEEVFNMEVSTHRSSDEKEVSLYVDDHIDYVQLMVSK